MKGLPMPIARLGRAIGLCGLLTLSTAVAVSVALAADEPAPSQLQTLLVQSRYDEAAALARESIAAAPSQYGEDSIEEANLLDALVQALYRSGHAMDAEGLEAVQRAIAIKESRLGHESRGVATSLMQLGNLYIFRGDNDGALSNYEQAAGILERLRATTEEPVDRDLAVILSNMGIVHKQRGDFDAALKVAHRALQIRRDTLGDRHPDLATSYNNIANILINLGRYAEARVNNEQSLQIREEALGPDHELVAESLNNLSTVLGYMGEFDDALAAQERALDIFTRVLGADNERTWTVQFNLAVLESDMGDYVGAQKTYEEVLAKQRARFGDRSDMQCDVLEALATAAMAQGDPARAKELLETSLSIYEESYGEGTDAADYALQGLGKALTELGEFERGAAFLERSLSIRESYGDPDSPELCEVLHALAELRLAEGNAKAAASLANRSRRIIESRLGPWHPLMAEAYSIAARARAAEGEYPAGFQDALRAESTSRRHLRDTIGVLSERLALDYAADRVGGLDLALSLLVAEENAGSALDAVIRSRALVFDEMAQRKRATHDQEDPALASLLARSRSAREQIANLSLRGPGWEDAATYKAMLDKARDEKEELDRAIALAAGHRRGSLVDADVGLAQVRAQLAEDQALVSFVRYGQFPLDAADWSEARQIDVSMYGHYRAFLLSGDGSAAQSVDLGPAETIDASVQAWREQIQPRGGVAARGFSRVARNEDGRMDTYTNAAQRLRREVWDPVQQRLPSGVKTVFVVPDGSLNLVNLGALVDTDGKFLIESEMRMWQLSTERSLVECGGAPPVPEVHEQLFIVGDPDYAAASTEPNADAVRGGKPILLKNDSCLDMSRLHFTPLPGARREANEVAELWSELAGEGATVTLLEGEAASERALKLAFGHDHAPTSVVHVATHGFFVADNCGASGMRQTNPLVLSGLAFAGADHWRESSGGENDGLLTAEEFAALDLGDVDLAVLSACDTGLGEIRTRSEGVFGLRRALQIAGARTVVMSLWSVGDEAGCRFMNTLYRHRFQDGRSMQEALRSASLALIREARTQGRSPHPQEWAAFVAVGDWR